MKKILWVMLVFFMVGCGVAQTSGESGTIAWYHDMEQAKADASAENKTMLVDFYTEWCGWCKKLDKDTYSNKEVAEFAKNFICVKIDADKYPQLTKDYKVRGFPSTVFLNSDGTLIEVVPGYMPPDKFLKLMERML
ncbi:MAG: thioredoxin family protein [PVC group bacterium]|nr:thioredoxin family protein [PVC group bacterium]